MTERSRWVATYVLGALLVAACGGGTPSSASSCVPAERSGPADITTAEPLSPLTGGDPLPEVALPVLGDDGGNCVTSADLLGTPALINFWATWCAFCVEEMPDLQAAHEELGDRVRFIGVDREDDVAQALDLAEATGVTYELLEDRDGSFFRAVKGRGMPTTVFVDSDGIIAYRHAGPLTTEQLRDLIDEHLGVR